MMAGNRPGFEYFCEHCNRTLPRLTERLRAEKDARDEEVEQLRMQLAGCGVAAMGNTPETVAKRIDKNNPYWLASYGDVCAAVDREMALRKERDDAVDLYNARVRRHELTLQALDEARAELEKTRAVVEAAKQARKACLCRRFKTHGFDYGEEHKYLGKPRPGARWLTPTDMLDLALAVLNDAAHVDGSAGTGNHEERV